MWRLKLFLSIVEILLFLFLKDPMDSGNCSCDPGWAGVSCDSECSEHGNITNGECECFYDDGWKGPLCDIPGCPGLNKLDCSGRGMFVLLSHFFMAKSALS